MKTARILLNPQQKQVLEAFSQKFENGCIGATEPGFIYEVIRYIS